MEKTVEERVLNLEGVENARDLGGIKGFGGKTVKSGKFIRTARLEDITAAGKETLKKLNVKYNMDMRADFEAEGHPDPDLEGIQRIQYTIIDMDSAAGIEAMKLIAGYKEDESTFVRAFEQGFSMGPLYKGFVTWPRSLEEFSRMMRLVIESREDEALLFHCNGGKDRTGTFAAILLGILGVSGEDILEDFEYSNVGCRKRIERECAIAAKYTDDPEIIRKTGSVAGVDRENMEILLDHLCEDYGSVPEFAVKKLGVTPEEINELRDKYLED